MRKRSELLFSLISVPVDVAALMTAFVTAYVLRVRIDNKPVAHPISGHDFVMIALVVMPFWILIFALSGLYNQTSLRGRLEEFGKVVVAVSGGVMFLILVDFASSQPIFPSKLVPIYTYIFGLVFVLVGRVALRMLQRYLFRYGIGVHQALLVGSGELAQRIALDLHPVASGYHLVGTIDRARGAAKRMQGVTVYDSLEQALAASAGDRLDDIIQADSVLDQEEIIELVNYATNHQVSYRFVPNQFGLYATNSVLGTMAGIPVMEIRLTPLDGWGRIAKRVFDVIGATFGLLLLSPLLLVLAVIVKVSDHKGPILYGHRRLSRAGGEVFVLKFRSMKWAYSTGANRPYKTAEAAFIAMDRPDLAREFQANQKVAHDPRVTRLGNWLRRSSLDELPQLINVLRGDMSLVGPRPIMPDELERYGEYGASFLALKPGITGLWQISGRSDLGYDQRVKLDIYYIENWTLFLDIRILIKTVFTITSGRGAY
ncbi:sugar transferase [Candidatus Saccharibacteria bacterium]|nr:sugar transferase [Candidatus Saccharibacteria bacterium]